MAGEGASCRAISALLAGETFHSWRAIMRRCILCGQELSAPELCPQCGSLEGLDTDSGAGIPGPASGEHFACLPSHMLNLLASFPHLHQLVDSTERNLSAASSARQQKMCVIFLDIDGVLNFPSESKPEALEPGPLQNLIQLLQTMEARVVISSTWRVHQRLCDKLQQALWLAGAIPIRACAGRS